MKAFRVSYILFFIVLLIILLDSCNSTKHVPKDQQLLSLNIIESDNKDFETAPIYNYLKQTENTKTAMFFNFHLWIYNISHDKSEKPKRLKRWLGIYKMGEIIGEPPVIMDTNLNELSVKQIGKYMRNKGYYRSETIDSVSIYGRKENKAFVYYKIKTGKPIQIDLVSYTISDSIISKIVLADTSNSFLKKNTN